jgi:prefoldin beta subunit
MRLVVTPTDPPQEFSNLMEEETIYKLIGPVLLKQERSDAESTVNGRLQFIEKEM